MFNSIRKSIQCTRLTRVDHKAHGACIDCGRRYGDEYGFPDLLIPDEIWEQILPGSDGGGLLCPCCILRRLYDADIKTVGEWGSGPLMTSVDTASLEAWIDSIHSWSKNEKFINFEDALKAAVKDIPAHTRFSEKAKTKRFPRLPREADLTKKIREVESAIRFLKDLTHRKMPESQDAYDTFAKDIVKQLKDLPTFNLNVKKNVKKGVRKWRIYLPPKQPQPEHARKTVKQLGYTEESLKRFHDELTKMKSSLPSDVKILLKEIDVFDKKQKKSLGLEAFDNPIPAVEVFKPEDGKKWFIDMGLGLVEAAALFLLIRMPYVIYEIIGDVRKLSTVYTSDKK